VLSTEAARLVDMQARSVTARDGLCWGARNAGRRAAPEQIVANAGRDDDGTFRAMPHRPSALDRRLLQPRDYLHNPWQFGVHPAPQWVLPPGGDERSLRAAMTQHEVARLLRLHCPRVGQRVADRFAFSRQLWSKSVRGHAWMGSTLLAGAIWALRSAGVWR
jgi:hypothetical protein